MKSNAKTVKDYLQELPENRRQVIEKVRDVILHNLPKGYEEAMNWGMISYQVPLEKYSNTYNKQPLLYVALASQKHHMAIYLNCVYIDPDKKQELADRFQDRGKKLNAGKSCIRFKTTEDLPLDIIGEYIAAYEVDEYIQKIKSIKKNSS